jgi:hypothetical protein
MPLEYLGFYEPQRYQPVQITKRAIFKRDATFMVAFFFELGLLSRVSVLVRLKRRSVISSPLT